MFWTAQDWSSQSNRAPMKCGHWRAIHPHREGLLKARSCCLELRMYSRKKELRRGEGRGEREFQYRGGWPHGVAYVQPATAGYESMARGSKSLYV
jgi:hypothetical protein